MTPRCRIVRSSTVNLAMIPSYPRSCVGTHVRTLCVPALDETRRGASKTCVPTQERGNEKIQI
jgi:hypothetical protein